MTDFQIKRSGRRCHATGRELQPGEEFWSELLAAPADDAVEFVRHDYCSEAWQEKGPDESATGCWRGRIPSPDAGRVYWAPPEVMKEYFFQLLDSPRRERAWVMAMLLVRKRLMKLEPEVSDEQGDRWLVVVDPATREEYRVPVVELSPLEQESIQQEFVEHLFTDQPGG